MLPSHGRYTPWIRINESLGLVKYCFRYTSNLCGSETSTYSKTNSSSECIVADEPSIFNGDTGDHDGPHDTVTMGC